MKSVFKTNCTLHLHSFTFLHEALKQISCIDITLPLLSSPSLVRQSSLPPLTFFNPPQPSESFLCAWPCPVKQGTCCGVVTHTRGQLHGRFCRPFFCSGVQSASICHCLATVPPGQKGLILQSISRRAAFVLSPAPMGPICFSARSLSLRFDGSHFLSHLFVHGALSLSGCVISCFISTPFLFPAPVLCIFIDSMVSSSCLYRSSFSL